MRAIGAWSGLAGVAGAIGPFLGGWIVAGGQLAVRLLDQRPARGGRGAPDDAARAGVVEPEAARRLDVGGALLGALGLAGLTYGLTAWSADGFGSPGVFVPFVGGVRRHGRVRARRGPLDARRWSRCRCSPRERSPPSTSSPSSSTPRCPACSSSSSINLQVVAGFAPLPAGLALLPGDRADAAAVVPVGRPVDRIGPRIPMTVGPLVCCAGARAAVPHRLRRDLPRRRAAGGDLLGLGLSATVAPLTATALAAAKDSNAGIASGVNNAVARRPACCHRGPAARLPGGLEPHDPVTLHPAYRTSMLVCAGLLAAGALLSALTIPSTYAGVRAGAEPRRPPSPS